MNQIWNKIGVDGLSKTIIKTNLNSIIVNAKKVTKSKTFQRKHTITKKNIVERSKDCTSNNIFPSTVPPSFQLLLIQNIIVIIRKLRIHPLVLVLCSQWNSRQTHFPIAVFLEHHLFNLVKDLFCCGCSDNKVEESCNLCV